MGFADAVALQPMWVQFWMKWMLLIVVISALVFAMHAQTRVETAVIIACFVPAYLLTAWMFDALGWVRLLGLPHIVFWTPMALFFWQRWREASKLNFSGIVRSLFLATICTSLLFDYADVIRYLLGDRAPLL